MFHVGMMNAIHKNIGWAIESSERKGETTETLRHLQNKNKKLLDEYAAPVADTLFFKAMNKPVSRDLNQIVDSVNALQDALEANKITKALNLDSETSEKTQLQDRRLTMMRNKVDMLKETISSGIILGDNDSDRVKPTLTYVTESMARIEVGLHAVELPIAKENNEVYAQKIYEGWNSIFQPGDAARQPSSMVERMEKLQTELRVQAKIHDVQSVSIIFGEQLHDLTDKLKLRQGLDSTTMHRLDQLKREVTSFLEEHVRTVATAGIVNMYKQPDIGNDYGNLMGRTIAARDAARVQEIAVKYAHNPIVDDENVLKISEYLEHAKGFNILGMDESTGTSIRLDNSTLKDIIQREIEAAEQSVEKMCNATIQANKSATQLIDNMAMA
jgi:hypothetical protein